MTNSQEAKDRLARIGKEAFADLDELRSSVKYQGHLQNHPQRASVYIVPVPQVFIVKQQQPVINSDQAAHHYGGKVIVNHRAN
ncbi:hypothetical protein HS088_TW14G01170 [Tripterygium wilfordii]|uniref:Uncharacterized protein n=1 Tax=Tripterygium wilfordii TaxID=458696 RepID=A0A7J7CSJ8_TRIWF|nr:hypothetical protein HS088_TW14G01170 [Tripterygium wilfordii]